MKGRERKGRRSSIGSTIADRLGRFAEAAESGEDITTRFTCRTIKLNLEPQPYSPELVKETRRKLGASQAIFARFLGVSPSAVRDWEQGLKPPHGAACRLMDEIRHDPRYWIQRMKELSMAR
jgi:DNA-binding transcriptional regulator YiaG